MNYEKDLEIDKFALDAECLDQPHRFMTWSKQWADAIAERDRLEQKVKIVEAQVEQNIRNNPESYGGKLTEAGIKSLVTTSSEVIQIREELIEISHQANTLLAARQAMEQRRSMLENLVKLFLSGYWADPKIKQETSQALTQTESERQREALNKSPRLRKRVQN